MTFGNGWISELRDHSEAVKAGGPVAYTHFGKGYRISSVAFVYGSTWVVQCLEYDIAAQGPSLSEALGRLKTTIAAEMAERGGSLDAIPPAPQRFFDMRESASAPTPKGEP